MKKGYSFHSSEVTGVGDSKMRNSISSINKMVFGTHFPLHKLPDKFGSGEEKQISGTTCKDGA